MYTNYSQYNNDTDLIFANGLAVARGYRIRPQQTVLLVDSTQSSIYLKSTDNLGIETMKTYSIAEVENKEEKDVETRLDKIETNINKIKKYELSKASIVMLGELVDILKDIKEIERLDSITK